jgi:L-asparaginase
MTHPLQKPAVRLLITGGTFDKEYNEITGALYFKDTHVQEMLRLGRSKLETETQVLMMIDSLEMTDPDRKIILEHCETAKEERLVITHGTDTMELTAQRLGKAASNPQSPIHSKTIVLTGAMVPYKFGSSDGLFNLGSALAFAQTLPAGVYIAMNGRYFSWSNVTKNRNTGEFHEI